MSTRKILLILTIITSISLGWPYAQVMGVISSVLTPDVESPTVVNTHRENNDSVIMRDPLSELKRLGGISLRVPNLLSRDCPRTIVQCASEADIIGPPTLEAGVPRVIGAS